MRDLSLSSSSAKMKKIRSEMKVISDDQGQVTPQSVVEFRQKFELIQAVMSSVTCKNEELLQSKNEELEC